MGTPNREPQEYGRVLGFRVGFRGVGCRNILEYRDPGRYVPYYTLGVPSIRFPLKSVGWGGVL